MRITVLASAQLAPVEVPGEHPSAVLGAVATALAPGARVEDRELECAGIGYGPKALGAGLWASCHPGSAEEGLLTIVNAGGDTDTNAAPAPAALGARFGFRGIPAGCVHVAEIRAWEAPVDAWLESRPIEEYADHLLALPEVGHG